MAKHSPTFGWDEPVQLVRKTFTVDPVLGRVVAERVRAALVAQQARNAVHEAIEHLDGQQVEVLGRWLRECGALR